MKSKMDNDTSTRELVIYETDDVPLAAALLIEPDVILVGVKQGPAKNSSVGRNWCTIELGAEDPALLGLLVAKHGDDLGGLQVPVKLYEQTRRQVLRAINQRK